MKKVVSLLLCAVMAFSAFGAVTIVSTPSVYAEETGKITKKERNAFYHQSGFIGSSIGVGQRMYFNSQGKNYLGHPVMMVRTCYSFYNDKHNRPKWLITYKGKPMQAKKAVKKSKVKRVFIAMGTNDFHYGANGVYKDYVEYIKGIRKANPNVVIFIESTTSVTAHKQGKCFNAKNIRKLNKLLEKYCKSQKDMYFVDVSSRMNNKNGTLKNKYASDNYCHLTFAAYKIWMDELVKYTDKLMLAEKAAKNAVSKAESTRSEECINKAYELVNKLEKSTVKDNLKTRLCKVEPIITEPSAPEETTAPAPKEENTSAA